MGNRFVDSMREREEKRRLADEKERAFKEERASIDKRLEESLGEGGWRKKRIDEEAINLRKIEEDTTAKFKKAEEDRKNAAEIKRQDFFKRQKEKDGRRQELENKINPGTSTSMISRKPGEGETAWKVRMMQKYEKDPKGSIKIGPSMFRRKGPAPSVLPGIKKLSETEKTIKQGDKIKVVTKEKKSGPGLLKLGAGVAGGVAGAGKAVVGAGAGLAAWGYKGLKNSQSSGAIFIIFAIILYLLDIGLFPLKINAIFNGIDFNYAINVFSNWNSLLSLLRFFSSILFIIVTIFVSKEILSKQSKEERLWFLLLIILTFLIVAIGNVGLGLILHLVFAFIYMSLFLVPRYAEDKAQAYKTTFFLMLFDFVGFSAAGYVSGLLAVKSANALFVSIGKYVSSRQLFPLWIFYTTTVSYKIKPGFIKVILIIFMVLFGSVLTLGAGDVRNGYDEIKRVAGYSPETNAADGQQTATKGWKEFWAELSKGVKSKYNESISYATGDYYTGKVDQNVKEPLGVYISNIETSAPEVYEDEEIELWATLKAKSIEEPIDYLKIECKADTEKLLVNKPEGESKVKEFTDFIDAEEDLDCKFEAGEFEAGSHIITFSATYDFTTLAYLKTYFIDDARLKALQREGIDVFNEYGITDKKPICLSTNGPVAFCMETKTPPIGISNEYDNTPKFGFTIENKWKGNIQKITDLIIYLPEGIELEDNCDGAFEKYEENEYQLEGYNAYSLVSGVKDSEETKWKDIDDYRSRNCRLNIKDVTKILGETPISIKYIKARIQYIYNSEESFSLTVKTPEGFNVYFDPKKPSLGDKEIKCVASHSKAYVVRAPFYIYKYENDDWHEILNSHSPGSDLCPSNKNKCDFIIPIIPKTDLKRGDKIKCKVYKAELSDETEESDSATTTIDNSAPIITGIFDPRNENEHIENKDLKCIGVITDYDKEDTEFNIMYEVKKNGERMSYDQLEVRWINNKQFEVLIKGVYLKKDDKIECTMTARDIWLGGESKYSEPEELTTIIIAAQATTTTTTISNDPNLNADCSKTGNEGKSCGGSSYMNCYQGNCISACKYLANKNAESVGSDWDCLCSTETWKKEDCIPANKCLTGKCPGNDYCCSPTATLPS